MFGWGNRSNASSSFQQHYRVFPCSFIEKPESGNKVYLPPSALSRLAQLHIEYPMLFRAENKRANKHTHCGVLEFIADEGSIYVPYWMMTMLELSEGDVLTLSNVSLPKGSYVKLQPHSSRFLDISNPRAVLERTLRGYSCLTAGDTISILYNDVVYGINVLETKPSDAVSVVETDVNVDFAPPLDYVEGAGGGGGGGGKEDEEAVLRRGAEEAQEAKEAKEAKEGQEGAVGGFAAFQGTARRLDGKPAMAVPTLVPKPVASASASGGEVKPVRKKSGKLMFKDRLAAKFEQGGGADGNGNAVAGGSREKKSEAGGNKVEKEEKGFKAFEGRSYSLKVTHQDSTCVPGEKLGSCSSLNGESKSKLTAVSTFETSQSLISWSKDSADSNILSMLVTPETFQLARGWLKLFASLNLANGEKPGLRAIERKLRTSE